MDTAYVMGATVVTLGTLGASVFPTKVTVPSGCIGYEMKLLSGASGAMILPNYLAGSNIAGATALSASLITGYPLAAIGSNNLYIGGPAAFYLVSGGATATVAFNFRFSASGVTLA